jgi:hypothetical protein
MIDYLSRLILVNGKNIETNAENHLKSLND